MLTPVPDADTFPRLLADIGGTNVRFAWVAEPGAALTACANYRCAEQPTIGASIDAYLQQQGLPRPRALAIGIAYPISGDEVRMTNGAWTFSISALQRELGLKRLSVINDFAALALGIPDLLPTQLHALGPGEAVAGSAIAVLGAGTGLGVAGLMPLPGGGWWPVSGEGGHATLAGQDEFEDAVIARLRQRFGHVSAERALSGPGLVNLYQAGAELQGQPAPALAPAEVLSRAEQGDALASQAIQLFCGFLGSVAGNLALSFGARGGVYIGGGVAPRLLKPLSSSAFRSRFEAKGRLSGFLQPIPCYVINAEVSPALAGASRALDLGL
ncbi:glucokinase [Paucibacter sp. APW11]|uniref:Glucokinase n=1 Tax=Roseateles aquae TaxID=3077235 RepID=A0ABU3PG41_9BURK|nr:glucokinase [Paucibacter sp. APW11]MDT9001555.1 glucokinase [Paucibacter sp. APW11]